MHQPRITSVGWTGRSAALDVALTLELPLSPPHASARGEVGRAG